MESVRMQIHTQEERNMRHLDDPGSEDNVARWIDWQNKPIEDQWRWMKEIGMYPRRRPVLGSNE